MRESKKYSRNIFSPYLPDADNHFERLRVFFYSLFAGFTNIWVKRLFPQFFLSDFFFQTTVS